jgi:hypothetical protein
MFSCAAASDIIKTAIDAEYFDKVLGLLYYDDLGLLKLILWGLSNVTSDLAQFAKYFFSQIQVLRRVISLTVNA